MSNIQNKPKLTAKQLVTKMKVEKGISFSKFSEKHAEKYLFDINNDLRTASYRKNYQKYFFYKQDISYLLNNISDFIHQFV